MGICRLNSSPNTHTPPGSQCFSFHSYPFFSSFSFTGSKGQGWLLNFVSRDREAAVLPTRIWHFSVLKSMAHTIFAMKSIIWWPTLVQQPIRSKLLHVSQICITKSSFPALSFFSLVWPQTCYGLYTCWFIIMLLKYSPILHFQSYPLFHIKLNQEELYVSFHLFIMINSLSYIPYIPKLYFSFYIIHR